MKTLNISAGGKSSRMNLLGGQSKHLLPLPGIKKSILGKIVDDAKHHFDNIVIWGGDNTPDLIKAFPGLVIRDSEMTGPLGPMLRNLVATKQRVYGCAGDFVCDFSWKEFEEFHNSHDFPVSILVARSVPTMSGARFFKNGAQIFGWERVEGQSSIQDLINIGVYIVDSDDRVIKSLEFSGNEKPSHKEDPFFTKMIALNLLAGYDPGKTGYNVNTQEIYNAINFLQTRKV